ncbi:hypothetical protein AAE02nite_10670 [Adhaeribacter aerolatus]|uniref:GyrI-like small molecule binding domain-containing protein n=1 Tax=Adhaeribacter aerolatus TaxID=670289 RepID=A0A512AUQ2_9BACT|nr:GyrI-like domain-containing protein [Adhaeribacter aerolatus]GEO03403.1 hypothetical protein AAE02nite_10670 [Adhaeribacter aerolatus]
MNKKFLLIALIVLGFGFSVYAYLGGFSTPEIKVTNVKTRYLAGNYYAGPVEGEQLGQLFRQAAEVLEKKEVPGVLANIYYNNPEKQSDSLKAFIGIMIEDSTAQLPAGYKLQKVAGGKVVQASVNAHYMLSPKKLYPALFDYLKMEKLKTKQTYLEIFPTDRTAIVQAEIIP